MLPAEVQTLIDAQAMTSTTREVATYSRPCCSVVTEQVNRSFVRFGLPGPEVDRVVDHLVPGGG